MRLSWKVSVLLLDQKVSFVIILSDLNVAVKGHNLVSLLMERIKFNNLGNTLTWFKL